MATRLITIYEDERWPDYYFVDHGTFPDLLATTAEVDEKLVKEYERIVKEYSDMQQQLKELFYAEAN